MTKSNKRECNDGVTLSCVVGFVGKAAALGIVMLAVAIAVVPRLLYTDLPSDISLDLTKPTTLIVTGANSGLGLATVQHFAHNEMATIIMACRSMTRCENAKQQIYDNLGNEVVKANLRPMSLDLSKKSSVEAFAKKLQNQPIDILINNAGLAGATPELTYNEEDGVETHIRVNHLGHVYLMHCLWKNLQMAEHGARVVAVSSVMGGLAANIPTFGWYQGEEQFTKGRTTRMYGCSKRANLFFANELHHRYKDTSSTISVVAAHPGFTHTELCKNGCKSLNKVGRFFSNLNLLTGIIKMTAEDGSLSQSYAAVIPQSGVYLGPSLALVGETKILGTLDSSWHHAPFTRDESKHLWDKSMEALGIKVFGDYEIPVEKEPVQAEGVQEGAITEEPEQVKEYVEQEGAKAVDDEEDSSSEDEEEEGVWNTYLGDGEYQEATMI